MPKDGYARIKSRYQLRGWADAPHTVLDRETSRVMKLSDEAFRTIQLCNGRFTARNPIFMGVRQRYLDMFDRAGVLEWPSDPKLLESEQHYRFYDNLHVTQALWSVTGHCNYRCKHCYMSAPHALLPQPSTEECLDMVDQMAACGIARVTITGGEPLVRGDFLQIVDRIQERDLHFDVLMTNGSLLTGELLDELEARGCHPEICLSYDGVQGWHEWMRGVRGAEDDFRRAMRLCREHGFVTCVETVLHKGNRDLLRETVAYLGELGASAVKVLALSCAGEAESIADYVPSPGEFLEDCLAYATHYVEDDMPVPILTLGPLKVFEGRFSMDIEHSDCNSDCRKMAICGSGQTMMFLASDGRILPCIQMSELDSMHDYFPSIGSTSLKEALSSSNYTRFVTTTLEQYLGHNPRCHQCAYKNPCGAGCREKALRQNGGTDLLGVDEEMCSFFMDGFYERTKTLIAKLQEATSPQNA